MSLFAVFILHTDIVIFSSSGSLYIEKCTAFCGFSCTKFIYNFESIARFLCDRWASWNVILCAGSCCGRGKLAVKNQGCPLLHYIVMASVKPNYVYIELKLESMQPHKVIRLFSLFTMVIVFTPSAWCQAVLPYCGVMTSYLAAAAARVTSLPQATTTWCGRPPPQHADCFTNKNPQCIHRREGRKV